MMKYVIECGHYQCGRNLTYDTASFSQDGAHRHAVREERWSRVSVETGGYIDAEYRCPMHGVAMHSQEEIDALHMENLMEMIHG